MENLAKEILDLNSVWEQANKSIIADNLERILAERFPDCQQQTKRIEKLAEITGSKKDSVYAWLNHGRTNVKTPLLKLCVIAAALEINIYEFLKNER